MLVFTGGDSLMRPDVFAIAEYAVQRCACIDDIYGMVELNHVRTSTSPIVDKRRGPTL